MLCVCYDALHAHLWSGVGQYIYHKQIRSLFCHVPMNESCLCVEGLCWNHSRGTEEIPRGCKRWCCYFVFSTLSANKGFSFLSKFSEIKGNFYQHQNVDRVNSWNQLTWSCISWYTMNLCIVMLLCEIVNRSKCCWSNIICC